jgi:hypothetical protein
LLHDNARARITEILGNVKFEGHFNKCFDNLKESQQNQLLQWTLDCKECKANPIQSKKNKHTIGFVKKFGSNVRAILTKEKSSFFIALFLDKHKYYENEITKLGF